MTRPNTLETLLDRVDATGDCWEWTGATQLGYGLVSFEGRRWRVHRLIWTLLVGPIPNGLVLDHLCRVRHCANPDHLEVVTQLENVRRGQTGRYQRSTICPRGHDRTIDPYVTSQGYRDCRLCRRRSRSEYKRRRRAREALS